MAEIDKNKDKIKTIAVTGPTASGKSALAIELAVRLGGEVISCDSMQVYKGLDIGTAKVREDEKRGIPHHMLDVALPSENFSSEDYALGAEKAVSDILSRGKLPIFCGGTGLYLDSFLRGARDDGATKDEEYRAFLSEFAEKEGKDALHAKLREIDPTAADAIHPNNVKRVIRALEVCHVSGRTKTELDALSSEYRDDYDPIIICLRAKNRELLYSRIDARVDSMITDGLENEVRELKESGLLGADTTAGQAIGYKEMLSYLNGECSLDEAAGRIKLASRRYAKRQETWFKRQKGAFFIDIDDGERPQTFENIVNNALSLFHFD